MAKKKKVAKKGKKVGGKPSKAMMKKMGMC